MTSRRACFRTTEPRGARDEAGTPPWARAAGRRSSWGAARASTSWGPARVSHPLAKRWTRWTRALVCVGGTEVRPQFVESHSWRAAEKLAVRSSTDPAIRRTTRGSQRPQREQCRAARSDRVDLARRSDGSAAVSPAPASMAGAPRRRTGSVSCSVLVEGLGRERDARIQGFPVGGGAWSLVRTVHTLVCLARSREA
jgi:hypothetical protein